MNDAQRNNAVRNGKWVSKFPERKVKGFHLSALHSPFVKLEELATEFLACQLDHFRLKTFINTILGEPFKPKADSADDIPLMSRVERFDENSIPENVAVLTCGADVQKDRIELTLIGHAEQNEKYVLCHKRFYGSPDSTDVLQVVKDFILQSFNRVDGAQLKVAATIIDSGGSSTQTIYKWTQDNVRYRIFAGKGSSGNRPLFPKKLSVTETGKLYILGVDSGKELLYNQLRVEEHGPNYIHFSDTLTYEYFEQLTSEKRELKLRNGYSYYQWVLPSGKSNEALDTFVYGLAAFEATGLRPEIQLRKLAQRKAREEAKELQEPAKAPTSQEAPEEDLNDPTPTPSTPTTNIPRRIPLRPRHRQSSWL